MRKSLIAVAILVVLGGSGYGYYRYTQKPTPPVITTARVTRGDIAETVGATGQLQAVTTVQVGTQVSGTLLELNADFNSLVRKGQVLARLDPSLFQTQIEQARANLIRAEADMDRLRVSLDDARTKFERAKELSAKKLIAQTELEAAEVAVRSAEAQLRSQQAAVTQSQASLRQNEVNLQHTVIEAPIDGLVISRNVDVGQTVAASMSAPTLFLLAADLTKMQVIASLDESDVGRIRPGQLVRFRVDAFPTEEFIGYVTQVRLQPTTVQNVVTYATVIDVPNPELKLKPGMTANVNIEIARRNNVLRVPNAALRFRPTNEIFAAFGQTPPPAGSGRGGGRGGGRGAGNGEGPDTRAPSNPQAAAVAANSAPSPPAANQTARRAAPTAQTQAAARQSPPVESRGRGEGAGNAGAGRSASADSPSDSGGRGRGFGGRGGGGGNFAERMAAMTAEERAQFTERMRARGFTPSADGLSFSRPDGGNGGGQGAQSGQGGQVQGGQGRGQQASRGGQTAQRARTPAPAPSRSGATTIDALFGPLASTESFGQAWLHQDGKLHRIRLRLGITDGQQSELLEVIDGGKLEEGTEVVAAISVGATRATAVGGNAFPGLGGDRRGGGGFPGGGFPGGGGGGGGRGGGRGQ